MNPYFVSLLWSVTVTSTSARVISKSFSTSHHIKLSPFVSSCLLRVQRSTLSSCHRALSFSMRNDLVRSYNDLGRRRNYVMCYMMPLLTTIKVFVSQSVLWSIRVTYTTCWLQLRLQCIPTIGCDTDTSILMICSRLPNIIAWRDNVYHFVYRGFLGTSFISL